MTRELLEGFSPAPGALNFGLATAAGTTGTPLWTSALLPPGAFAQQTHTFTAAVAATELSIEVDPIYDTWLWLDGVTLVGAGPTLVWNGTCPGGGVANMTGMTPAGTVYLGYSALPGPWPIPGGSCAGTVIDLIAPTLAAVLVADGAGNASLTANVPICGVVLV